MSIEIEAGLQPETAKDKFKNFGEKFKDIDANKATSIAATGLEVLGSVVDRVERGNNSERPMSAGAGALQMGAKFASYGAMTGNPAITAIAAGAGATIGAIKQAQEMENYKKLKAQALAKKRKNDYIYGREQTEIMKNRAHELYTA